MAYLLDANVLISAKRDHYRFATFPCFWDFLLTCVADGVVLSVASVKRELEDTQDELSQWVVDACPGSMFAVPDGSTGVAMTRLATWTMSPERLYTPEARSEFLAAADSVLVAHALAHGHVVVTHETPQPLAKRRVKIPDACNGLGVPWVGCYQMLQDIGARF